MRRLGDQMLADVRSEPRDEVLNARISLQAENGYRRRNVHVGCPASQRLGEFLVDTSALDRAPPIDDHPLEDEIVYFGVREVRLPWQASVGAEEINGGNRIIAPPQVRQHATDRVEQCSQVDVHAAPNGSFADWAQTPP